MMKFTLSIDLGADAMKDSEDIARALNESARQVLETDLNDEDAAMGIIRDINGNRVGGWEVRE